MTVNKAKQRMLEGKPAIGGEVALGSPLSAELISPLGFDFVLVDTQHGVWADESAMLAFRAIGLGTAVPMARVRRNNFGLIGRLLDMGCMGIVVPMVNNAEEAEAAVFATRYPPRGGRSIGNFGTGFLGDDYDVEIVELFHRNKVDAPSGTSLALGRAAAAGRGGELKDLAVYQRDGEIGPRPSGAIGFAVLRGGDSPGEHTVIFAGAGERVEIAHKASSRAIYTQGAVAAARWAVGKPAGLYSMRDVLGLA